MNRTEHLQTIAMEECVEVAQRISKAQRFGVTETQRTANGPHPAGNNHERIRQELGDLLGVLDLLGILDLASIGDAELRLFGATKQLKIEKYLAYAATCGTLTP